MFLPISKIDKERRTVSGYASTPTKDSDGEVISLDAVKAALPDYMAWGNIREMHGLSAVGVAQDANMDHKGLFLTARIVDDRAWKKCVEGVYKGFSIGGSKLAKEGDTITKLEMTEISIVDRPANPDCKIELVKSAKPVAEGAKLLRLKPKTSPVLKAATELAKAAAELAKAGGPPACRDGFSLPAPQEKSPEPFPKIPQESPDGVMSQRDSRPEENITRKAEDLPEAPEPPKTKGKKPKGKGKKATKKLAKAQAQGQPLAKSMRTIPDLSTAFDQIRSSQRSWALEAKAEGKDKADLAMANELGQLATKLAEMISKKAEHEGQEAKTMTDADDLWVSQLLGKDSTMSEQDDLGKAILGVLQKALKPDFKGCMGKAKENLAEARKARKMAKSEIEEVHKLCKAAYLSKAAKGKKDEEDEGFSPSGVMEKLAKAYGEIQKMGGLMKAAGEHMAKAESIVGEVGQRPGDADGKFYEVPPGIRSLSNGEMSRTSPGGPENGSAPPEYPGDGSVYAGKAMSLGDLAKSESALTMALENARLQGKIQALESLPANVGGRKPYAFDLNKVSGSMGGQDKSAELFKGVNPSAWASDDPNIHNEEVGKVIGNLLLSGKFGKSMTDPNFHGTAGGNGE
jgi:phage head maturation protease